MKNCKYCGKPVETGQMSIHVRRDCETYWAIKNGKPPAPLSFLKPAFDAVAMIDSLDSDAIREQIAQAELQLKALNALLTVAEAKQAPSERFNVPERFEPEATAAL